MTQTSIILIEDEVPIADTVTFALEQEGFAIRHHALGRAGLADLRDHGADLIILDVGLPDMSGLDICREIRRTSGVPIIFLSARAHEVDRIVGLEIGGDDYVTKPFSPRELVARVRAILRRGGESPAAAPDAPIPSAPAFEHDEKSGTIAYQGRELDLTRHEYLILTTLLSEPGRIFSRAQIMDRAWESPDTSLERAVDTHIKGLRAKLRTVTPDDDPIQTKRGFGYCLRKEGHGA